ncbi:hypothetical protein [Nocardia thraciensis]
MTESARQASGSVVVDSGALSALAGKLKQSAGAIGNQAKGIQAHTFGAAQAGMQYGNHGKKINEGLVRIESWLLQWQEASDALADAMGQSVVIIGATDAANAQKVASTGTAK